VVIIRFHVQFHVRLENPTLVVIVIVEMQSSAPVTNVRITPRLRLLKRRAGIDAKVDNS
jgi:hypothetical protein